MKQNRDPRNKFIYNIYGQFIYRQGRGLVAQSCPTLCNPMKDSLPGFSQDGIPQARILQRDAIPFSRGSSWPRGWTRIPHTAGKFFTNWATSEAQGVYYIHWRKDSLSDKCLQKMHSHIQKIKSNLYYAPHTKTNTKWINTLNLRPEIIILKETCCNLLDIIVGDVFFLGFDSTRKGNRGKI